MMFGEEPSYDGLPEEEPMTPKKDLYSILGVKKDADLDSIKKAYKKLALKYHPDKNLDNPEAAAIFQDVNLAHNVLSDPDKRKYYEETGDTEDVDLSAEDFMAMFREMMLELMAGVSIKEMLSGMAEEELGMMPPFPFPKELFPAGTFPNGLRCNSEGLKGIPPSVNAILKGEHPERLGEMFETAKRRDDDDDEDAERERRRRQKFFGGSASSGGFNPFGGGGGGDLGGLAGFGGDESDFDEEDLFGFDFNEAMLLNGFPSSSGRKSAPPKTQRKSHRKRGGGGQKGHFKPRRGKIGAEAIDLDELDQASEEILLQILGGNMGNIPSDMASMEKLMQSAMGLGAMGGMAYDDDREDPATYGGLGDVITELPPETAQSLPVEAPAKDFRKDNASTENPKSISGKVGKEWITSAKAGDSSALSSLLEKHPDLLNFCGSGVGHTALHWLCAKNYKGLVVWIIGQGAAVNKRNNEGSTPLHAAASNGNIDCVQMLIHYGANPTLEDSYGDTASKVAKERKHHDISKFLVQACEIYNKENQAPQRRSAEVPSSPEEAREGMGCASKKEEETVVPKSKNTSLPGEHGTSPSENAAPIVDNERQNPPKDSSLDDFVVVNGNGSSAETGKSIDSRSNENTTELTKQIPKDMGRKWMKAAQSGEVDVLKSMLTSEMYLLVYKGSGTSYSFTGNTAIHWCAAKGHTEALRWLLSQGGDPNGLNNAGSTPVHSAAANGQYDTASILLFEFGGDALIADGLGDLPRDCVIAKGQDWCEEMVSMLDLSVKTRQLRNEEKGNWTLKAMRTILSLAKKEHNFAEKSDFQQAVQRLLEELPQPCKPLKTAEEVQDQLCSLIRLESNKNHAKATGPLSKGAAEGAAEEEATDQLGQAKASSPQQSKDEEESKADLKCLSRKAKSRGNEAFQSGDFQKSTYHYSMAIRLDPGNHVNYSNRSASQASQGKWQNALEDAEKCIRIAPDWGKGFARKAAALLGMGQAGEALKVYKAGLKAEPGNAACKSGIESAKESIRMHQQRYEDMWGKSS